MLLVVACQFRGSLRATNEFPKGFLWVLLGEDPFVIVLDGSRYTSVVLLPVRSRRRSTLFATSGLARAFRRSIIICMTLDFVTAKVYLNLRQSHCTAACVRA